MRVTLSHLLSVHELMILIIEHGVYTNSDFEYLPQLKMERFFLRGIMILNLSVFSS